MRIVVNGIFQSKKELLKLIAQETPTPAAAQETPILASVLKVSGVAYVPVNEKKVETI